MPEWTEQDLCAQFERARQAGWLPLFQAAAGKYNFDAALLLAVASRETNIRQIKGDFRNGIYHGYGLMQIDIGTDRKFCEAWSPDQVAESIDRGAQILAGKRTVLAARGIRDPRAWAAAYNTGEGNVTRSIAAGRDPDSTTTGHDYGADVMRRAAVFANFLSGSQPAGKE